MMQCPNYASAQRDLAVLQVTAFCRIHNLHLAALGIRRYCGRLIVLSSRPQTAFTKHRFSHGLKWGIMKTTFVGLLVA